MSTFRSSAYRFNPGDSSNVYMESVAISRTARPWGHNIFVFPNSGAIDKIYFKITVPQNYGSQPALIIVWTTALASAGDVEWEFRYTSYRGNDSSTETNMNASTVDETFSSGQNDTMNATAYGKNEHSINLNINNFSAGDTVLCELARDTVDSGDTISADVHLEDVFFQYNDDFI